MWRALAKKMVAYFDKKTPFKSAEDIEKVTYILTAFSKEFVSFLLLIVTFGIIGKINEFWISFIVVMLTRTFSGGIHENSSVKCFMHTVAFFVLSIELSSIELMCRINWAVYSLFLLMIIIFAPVNNHSRGEFSASKRKRMRRFGIGGLFFSILFSLLFEKYSGVVTGTIFVELIEYTYVVFTIWKGGEHNVGKA